MSTTALSLTIQEAQELNNIIGELPTKHGLAFVGFFQKVNQRIQREQIEKPATSNIPTALPTREENSRERGIAVPPNEILVGTQKDSPKMTLGTDTNGTQEGLLTDYY